MIGLSSRLWKYWAECRSRLAEFTAPPAPPAPPASPPPAPPAPPALPATSATSATSATAKTPDTTAPMISHTVTPAATTPPATSPAATSTATTHSATNLPVMKTQSSIATTTPSSSSSVLRQTNSNLSSLLSLALSPVPSIAEAATSDTGSSEHPQLTGTSSQHVHNHNSKSAVIGGTIGGIVGLLLLSSVIFVICKRKRASSASPLFDKEKFYSNRIRSRRADDALDGHLIPTSVSTSTTQSSVESSHEGGSIAAVRERLLEKQMQSLSSLARKEGYSRENALLDAEITALRTYIERKELEGVTYWRFDDPPPSLPS